MVELFKWLNKIKRILISTAPKQNLESVPEKNKTSISTNLQENLVKIQDVFANASDLVIRQFEIGSRVRIKAFIAFIDGLVDKEIIQLNLLKPLMIEMHSSNADDEFNQTNALNIINQRLLTLSEVEETNYFEDAVEHIVAGSTALFLEGSTTALIASMHGWEARNVSQPDTEVVVRGPREGFTETLRTCTSLLRRRIKNPNLKFEKMTIGKQTKTDVVIAYIKGIANDKIVEEVKRRLSRIDTDSILESGYIEQYIEDNPWSFLPTIGNSEKPDIVAAKMLEGRVAILTDGTPFVLTVPYLFIEAFQSSEDY